MFAGLAFGRNFADQKRTRAHGFFYVETKPLLAALQDNVLREGLCVIQRPTVAVLATAVLVTLERLRWLSSFLDITGCASVVAYVNAGVVSSSEYGSPGSLAAAASARYVILQFLLNS